MSEVDVLAGALSFFADHGLIIIISALLEVLRKQRSLTQALLRLAIVGFPILLLTSGLKHFFNRSRPEGLVNSMSWVRLPTSPSFPSGHTLAASASAVALARTPMGIVLAMMNLLGVAWSRIRLGAHHKSDVLGGLVIGLLLGLALRPLVSLLDQQEPS